MGEASIPRFAGNSHTLQFEDGAVFRETYSPDGRSLRWEGLEGPFAGSAETVSLYVGEVADGVYFVSWLESSGMTVSRVMDFNNGTAQDFWTKPAEAGRGGRVAEMHTGTMSPA
ncbi:hypothetical protein [Micromonospora sp. NPDC049301]|uniref:MoaF-related domain-containing protein n=1 Tax=Micromonospora sp. NPDC049301 TaxID=3155723 RepID=UPI0034248CA5